MRKKTQEYTPAEFDAVIALIRHDAGIQADIEAITGQPFGDKTPRELFELFLTIGRTADVQATVARYGQARHALRTTRAQLAEPVDVEPATATLITRLETQLAELKTHNAALRATNKALMSGKAVPFTGRVVRGEVAQ